LQNKQDFESAQEIVERLQAGGESSALSITPVKPHSNHSLKENNNDLAKMMTGSGALSITPVLHHSGKAHTLQEKLSFRYISFFSIQFFFF